MPGIRRPCAAVRKACAGPPFPRTRTVASTGHACAGTTDANPAGPPRHAALVHVVMPHLSILHLPGNGARTRLGCSSQPLWLVILLVAISHGELRWRTSGTLPAIRGSRPAMGALATCDAADVSLLLAALRRRFLRALCQRGHGRRGCPSASSDVLETGGTCGSCARSTRCWPSLTCVALGRPARVRADRDPTTPPVACALRWHPYVPAVCFVYTGRRRSLCDIRRALRYARRSTCGSGIRAAGVPGFVINVVWTALFPLLAL